MPSFKIPTADERPYRFSEIPEEEKLYNDFSNSIWKYKAAVTKISSTADIKQIELARIAKEASHENLEKLRVYFNEKDGVTDIPENLRVLTNVLGSINDMYNDKLK